MTRPELPRPSLALVVALLALVMASGGTGYAAGLAKNSVGTQALRNGAVAMAKLKNNAVTSDKVKNGAVTRAKVAPNAIAGPQVAPDSLGGADVDEAGLVGGRSVTVVPAVVFATNNTTDFNRDGGGCLSPVTAGAFFTAEIDVPHGARLTGVQYAATDNDPTVNVDVRLRLFRRPTLGAAPDEIGTGTSADSVSPTVREIDVPLGAGVVIDRTQTNIMQANVAIGTTFCGVRLTYSGGRVDG